MKPSRLVTSGGVRRHTVRGMRKITKAALLSGAAAVALAATVGVAAPANAYGPIHVTSYVSWTGGGRCLDYEYPSPNGSYTVTDTTCASSQVTEADYYSYPGELIGANPIMGSANQIHCSLWLNGQLNYESWANAGDGHDANCLRVLTG